MKHERLANHLLEVLKQYYQVNLYENDIVTVVSRIDCVQANVKILTVFW